MAPFRAKYGGKCARCPRAIVPGQLIEAARGVRPRHVDCAAAGQPDILWRERKLGLAAHHMAEWSRRNPPPDLDRQVVKLGGPEPPDLSDYFDDEERRWARGRYEAERDKWLASHPDLVAAHNAAAAQWRQRRDAEAAAYRAVAQRKGTR